MEDLFYFMLFAGIIGLNILVKNKGIFKKLLENFDLSEPVESKITKPEPVDNPASKKLEKIKEIYPQSQNIQKTATEPVKTNKSVRLKSSLRDAIIWKEILDKPLALR